MSLNSINTDYSSCKFGKKHMNSKDKFDVNTKDGCGRVFAGI